VSELYEVDETNIDGPILDSFSPSGWRNKIDSKIQIVAQYHVIKCAWVCGSLSRNRWK